MALVACITACSENTASGLPANQMPVLYPSGGGGSDVPGYDNNVSYSEGTVVSRNGKYYAANADIPAGTPFTVGTSGATWREVTFGVAIIPPFSEGKSYNQYEAVEYEDTLFTAIGPITPGPWNPAQWNPISVGGGVTVVVSDSSSLDLSGDGSIGDPVTGVVKISANAGNQVTIEADGLFVPIPPEGGLTAVASTDSTTVDFGGDGTVGTPLTAAVKISGTAGNQVTSDAGGLFVPAAAAAAITANDTATVDLAGNGTVGTPLTANVKRSATAGNALSENADGLYAPTVTPGMTGVTHTDSATVDFSGTGTVGVPLTAAVKRSATAGNAITENADGLYVPAAVEQVGIVETASTGRTFILTDAQKYVRFTAGATKTATVPANATVAFPVGTVISFVNAGAGLLTIAAAGGVTINKPAAQSLNLALYAAATLTKVSNDIWDLAGGLEAV